MFLIIIFAFFVQQLSVARQGAGDAAQRYIFAAQKCDIRLRHVIYFAAAKCDIFRLRGMLRKTLTRFDLYEPVAPLIIKRSQSEFGLEPFLFKSTLAARHKAAKPAWERIRAPMQIQKTIPLVALCTCTAIVHRRGRAEAKTVHVPTVCNEKTDIIK